MGNCCFKQKKRNNYEILKTLNESKRKMYIARDTFMDQYVILKESIRNPLTNEINKEMEILSVCNNDFIIKFFGIYEIDQTLYNIIEYNEGIDLYDQFLENDNNINELKLKDISYQICLGLQYLKNMGIIHRDIKPENIIIDYNGNIKLIDFDLAIFYNEQNEIQPAGTLDYIAPELIAKKKSHYCNDIWSLGVTVFVIAYDSFPYIYNNKDNKYYFNNNISKDNISKFSIKFQELIKKILKKDYNKRLDIDTILSDEWFLSNN